MGIATQGASIRKMLRLVIERSGADDDLGSASARVRLHRLIYLAQRSGMPKLYTFRWADPYGPMSTRLSADITDLSYNGPDEGPPEHRLTAKTAAAVDAAAASLRSPDDLPTERWETAVAVVSYLTDIGYIDESGEFTKPPQRLRMDVPTVDLIKRLARERSPE